MFYIHRDFALISEPLVLAKTVGTPWTVLNIVFKLALDNELQQQHNRVPDNYRCRRPVSDSDIGCHSMVFVFDSSEMDQLNRSQFHPDCQ